MGHGSWSMGHGSRGSRVFGVSVGIPRQSLPLSDRVKELIGVISVISLLFQRLRLDYVVSNGCKGVIDIKIALGLILCF